MTWEQVAERVSSHKEVAAGLGLMWLASYLYSVRKWKEAHRVAPPLKWKVPTFWTAVSSFFTLLITYLFFI